jgi:hypothetical protein
LAESQKIIIIFRKKEDKLWRILLVAFFAFHVRVGISYAHVAVVVATIELNAK